MHAGGQDAVAHSARAPGLELLPWVALAVLAIWAAMALGLLSISRRRALEGLTPAEDEAVRTVAANRLVRTGVLMLWFVLWGAWVSFVDVRQARASLAEVVPSHPAALPLEPATGWMSTVELVLSAGGLVLALVLLLWRSPTLRLLSQDRAVRDDGAARGAPA